MYHGFQDVFFWYHALHILDKVVSLSGLIVLEVVDHQVEACLWNHINQGREYLESILTTAEYHKVMTK